MQGIHRIGDRLFDRSRLQLDRELAALPARDLEQIIDHRLQLFHVAEDDLEIFALILVQLAHEPVEQDRDELIDGIER